MPGVDSNLHPLMGTKARCEKTPLSSIVVGRRMRYGQGLELLVQEVWKLGRAEMGIEKEEREKTRAYKLGNAAENVMGSLSARERWHRDKL